jgi:hypothetical protein
VTRAPPRDTVAPTPGADTAAADSMPPDPLELRVREAALLPAAGVPLPARELMVVLAQPLVPEAEYVVAVGGILNLAGVAGGGGSATFRAPVPPLAPVAPPVEEAAPLPEGETPEVEDDDGVDLDDVLDEEADE